MVAQVVAAETRPSPAEATDATLAIRVKGVGKLYNMYERPQDRLKQMLFSRFGKHYGRDFWALRGVSFEVAKGETLGIIGRNGSGKSTLVQMIAGTLAPTEGEITVNGRIGALLELGSGFNPEFTGRENVFMNGSILGLSQEEIAARFDDIAAFADIGTFIDQPIKTYSSGMMVRLAFAVQACVDPEILIIDEALAVGDVFFRQKCYRRLEDLRERGTSILLVSHSMVDIEEFCRQAVLLDRGQPVFVGSAMEAVKRYYLIEQHGRIDALQQSGAGQMALTGDPEPELEVLDWPRPEAFLDLSHVTQVTNGWARCTGVAITDSQGRPSRIFEQGERARFHYEFEALQDFDVPIGGLVLYNDKGTIVHGKNTLQYESVVPRKVQVGQRLRFTQTIALEVASGEYTFLVGLATLSAHDYRLRERQTHQDVDAKVLRICHLTGLGPLAVGMRHRLGPTQLLHHGLANLPGEIQVQVVAAADTAPPGGVPNVRVVVAEYPRSGGTWVTSMLGDALGYPKRDIYIKDGYDWFDASKHPWYWGAESLNITGSCVIKSHELPTSTAHTIATRVLHLLRDGRDVIVSKFYFERDFCVANGMLESFNETFDQYLLRVAAEWRDYVTAWLEQDVATVKYEDFLADPEGTLAEVTTELGFDVSQEQIRSAVTANTKERTRKALDVTFTHNTLVRKGVAGDWKNHFTAEHREVFKYIAGDLLIRLGYEQNADW